MSIFNTSDNEVKSKGFINKDEILKYVTEEDIFELVFGFKPIEYERVSSPFREDNRPGCWFHVGFSGRLLFCDWGSQIVANGQKVVHIDCFSAVQIYYNLNSLYESLHFIRKHLIQGKNLPSIERTLVKRAVKKDTLIYTEVRPFFEPDKRFWSRYQITSQNLIDDKVFAVNRFKVLNGKNGDWICSPTDVCYAYTEFENNKKKIYRPYKKDKMKFISNCVPNDIGGLRHIDYAAKQLMVAKAYKDYRVLKNQGKNVIWFQNEVTIPDVEIIIPIISHFNEVIVFYDNDRTGITQSLVTSEVFNSHIPNIARPLYLPERYAADHVKDPSDLIHRKGEIILNQFLNENT